jgi:hypothetical protein
LRGTLVLGVVTTALLSVGCGREERSIVTWAELEIAREDEVPEHVHLEGRLYEVEADAGAFRRIWDAVAEGEQPFEALALTLSGGGEASGDGIALLAGMMIVLPLPLRLGASWVVTSTRTPPQGSPDMPTYWSVWGGRALRQAGEAELALRLFDYHTAGMLKEHDFIATGVTGTVVVTARYDELWELTMDLMATSDDGRMATIRGDMRLSAERYTPPF